MTEEKVKKRGWVKNAAIVFLSVMLVLTFFSNTIMNRSLPEVAAQYAQSGSITTRIRGTGTVAANENYEVKSIDSRKVQSVAVKPGQTVAVGDVLFLMAEGDSTELDTAKQTLEDLRFQYETALINATDSDYAKENRDIQLAKEALEEAVSDRDAIVVSDGELQNAKEEVRSIEDDIAARKAVIAVLQEKVSKAQADLDTLGGRDPGSDGGSGLYAAVQAAQAALNEANTDLSTARLLYQGKYDALKELAEQDKIAAETPGAPVYDISIYMAALAVKFKDDTTPITVDGTACEYKDLAAAYNAIEGAETEVEECQRALEKAQNDYYSSYDGGNAAQYDQLAKKLTAAQKELATAQSGLETAQARLETAKAAQTEVETRLTEYEAAVDAAKLAQRSLEDLVFALEEQQKADGKTQSLDALNLEKLAGDIEDAQEDVDELGTTSAGGEIVSEVDGIVKSVGISAGDTADPATPMATIEVAGRGYSVSITVTAEQAKKVSVGDPAEIDTGWWGSEITATLATIRTDPEAPNQNKILTFDVSGDVEAGTQVSLSVGQKSQNYDVIVPNSAIRTDANGSFVLIVIAKSSPLGNRYIATRADVQVLASDDMNTAISGGVANGDFIVTTSTKPLESGMQVRMAEGYDQHKSQENEPEKANRPAGGLLRAVAADGSLRRGFLLSGPYAGRAEGGGAVRRRERGAFCPGDRLLPRGKGHRRNGGLFLPR